MTEQLTLIETPPKLTARQAHALELVANAGAEGIRAHTLGALLHAENRKHPAAHRCDFCARDGNALLKALRKKGVVRYRRGRDGLAGYWQAVPA